MYGYRASNWSVALFLHNMQKAGFLKMRLKIAPNHVISFLKQSGTWMIYLLSWLPLLKCLMVATAISPSLLIAAEQGITFSTSYSSLWKNCQLCVSPVNYSDSYSETAEILSRWSYTLLQSVSGHFSLASILEAVYQYLVPIPSQLALFESGEERKMSTNECDGGYCDHMHTNRTHYCPNYHVRLLFIYYAPNFEKVDRAYCFWSVRAWVRHIFCTYCNF